MSNTNKTVGIWRTSHSGHKAHRALQCIQKECIWTVSLSVSHACGYTWRLHQCEIWCITSFSSPFFRAYSDWCSTHGQQNFDVSLHSIRKHCYTSRTCKNSRTISLCWLVNRGSNIWSPKNICTSPWTSVHSDVLPAQWGTYSAAPATPKCWMSLHFLYIRNVGFFISVAVYHFLLQL